MNIVKVRYFIHDDTLSTREYTYYSADKLNVGDIVTVPVRDSTGKAQVTSINVPESEIEAFKDKVKTIPAGSVVKPEKVNSLAEAARAAGAKVTEAKITYKLFTDAEVHCAEAEANSALMLRLGEDIEVHGYFTEASKMLEYAERRVIKTLDDAKLATDDLSLISELKKSMEAKRKEKLAPHEAQVKAIRDTYTYLMTPVLEAERITKSKQIAFIQEQERIRHEQEEINRMQELAAQKQKELTGEIIEVAKVEVVEAPKRIRTDLGSTGQRDNWKWKVTDINLIPREYLMINAGMLTPVVKASKGRLTIPGIEIYNEKILVVN